MVIGEGSSMEKKVRARARRMELPVVIFALRSHHKACMKTWTKYTRCHFIIFVQGLLKVPRHLNIGPGPCNFEILQYRLFSSPYVWGNRVRVVFGPLLQGATKFPSVPPYIQPLGRRLDLGFDYIKVSHSSNFEIFVCVDRPGQARIGTPTFLNHSSYIRNIQIAILSSCLFFDCLQELDLRGQVDRASAGSISSRSWIIDR